MLGMVWIGMDCYIPAGPGDSVVDVIPPNIEMDPRIFDELRNTLTVCEDYDVELCQLCAM